MERARLVESLSVVVPIYREGPLLGRTLPRIWAYVEKHRAPAELLLVTDGPDRQTRNQVESFVRQHPDVRWIHLERNRGKGHAVRTGAREAHHEVVAFLDADLSLPIQELGRLLNAIFHGADAAIASRRHPDSEPRVRHPFQYRSWAGFVLNAYVRRTFGLPYRDTQCGMKAFRREVLQAILPLARVEGFAFDVEWLVLAREAGFRVVEVGIRWEPRSVSSVRLLRDGWRAWRELRDFRRRLPDVRKELRGRRNA